MRIEGAIALAALLLVAAHAAPVSAQTTIVIDGANDFGPEHALAGGDGATWYVASDATHVYVGVAQSSLGSGGASEWVTLYLDVDPQPDPLTGEGTSTGVAYGTQQPALAFLADHHVRVRSDVAFQEVLSFTVASWSSSGIPVSAAGGLGFVELAVARDDLGAASAVRLAGGLVYEGSILEQTYGLLPDTLTSGYDPDLSDFVDVALFEPSDVPGLAEWGAVVLSISLAWTAVAHARRRAERAEGAGAAEGGASGGRAGSA